ncbi:tRNA-uridine aminocarboxypropyltransferase [Heracleum sosnowskyi]|uniref:tRNA-uridine aminocarboxypropyltransferase n=1 Tax=Heracleum sosnowskyi TaxID=360622 RepID=A0AAD8MF38_9APIA|nr:tRNA-uridine aminocarboxypropyltransferase [Heracleum sosnowskyi]
MELNLTDTSDKKPRRRICTNGCDRPINVCLCHKIPRDKISTATKIIIIQHPHETRHKLATVPVLAKCLGNCEIVFGRRLRRNVSPFLDSLYDDAVSNPENARPVVFLFPASKTMPSVDIEEWKSLHADDNADDNVMSNLVLIVFDATWKHAKEMVHASLPFLTKFATQVSLPISVEVDGASIFSSELTLRKEPFSGCMSTMEAIARCLRVLEQNGDEIESRLIELLRDMVKFQASFLKPMKPRVKLLKKSKAVGIENRDNDSRISYQDENAV